MIASLIIVDIFIVVFGFLGWKKYLRGKHEKLITRVHLVLLFLCVACIFFVLNSFMFWGKYTHPIIGICFLCSTAVLFAVASTPAKQTYSILIMVPVFMINIGWAGISVFLLPALVPMAFFDTPSSQYAIDNNHSIEARSGFMGPPPVFLDTRKLIIFKEMKSLYSKEHSYDEIQSARFISRDSIEIIHSTLSEPFTMKDTMTLR